MSQTIITVTDARDNLSEILGRVKYGRETVTIEKKGKPYAVIISPDQYAALQKAARERFGQIVRRIQSRNKGIDEEKLERTINQAVEEVRQELYEAGE